MDEVEEQAVKRLKNEDGSPVKTSFRPEELNLEEEAKLMADGVGENFKRYEQQKVTCLPPDKVIPVEKFEDVITSDLLLKNIAAQKYSQMSPIQKWAMPSIMDSHDLIACAQTGSGKTAAFLLPILQTLSFADLETHDPNDNCTNPYCLIISPTRELANQIYTHATMLSKDSIIRCLVIYGKISTAHLKAKLQLGCHVLVATPGRLKDFVERGWIGFKNIKFIVLDEGDRLVDEGFMQDIQGFFNHGTMPPAEKRQVSFFSATFREETQRNAKTLLKEDFIFLTVGRIGAANEDIKQEFIQIERSEKKRELKKILLEVPEEDKVIVFTQTKNSADILAGFFSALNLSSTSIHGDRLQEQREQAIKAFRRGEKRFLISSPVGNRGLDLPKVALVINYDLPKSVDEYVHRIGRTGRAGHTGRAISFYDNQQDYEILPDLIEILKEAKQEIPEWMNSAEQPNNNCTTDQDNWGFDSGKNNDDENWGFDNAKSDSAGQVDWGSKTNDNSAPDNDDGGWGCEKPKSNSDDQGGWGSTTGDSSAQNTDAWGSSSKGSNGGREDGGWGSAKPRSDSSGRESRSRETTANDCDDGGWGGAKSRPYSGGRGGRGDRGGRGGRDTRPRGGASYGGGWGSNSGDRPSRNNVGSWGSNPGNTQSNDDDDGWGFGSGGTQSKNDDQGWGSSTGATQSRNDDRDRGSNSGDASSRNTGGGWGSNSSDTPSRNEDRGWGCAKPRSDSRGRGARGSNSSFTSGRNNDGGWGSTNSRPDYGGRDNRGFNSRGGSAGSNNGRWGNSTFQTSSNSPDQENNSNSTKENKKEDNLWGDEAW